MKHPSKYEPAPQPAQRPGAHPSCCGDCYGGNHGNGGHARDCDFRPRRVFDHMDHLNQNDKLGRRLHRIAEDIKDSDWWLSWVGRPERKAKDVTPTTVAGEIVTSHVMGDPMVALYQQWAADYEIHRQSATSRPSEGWVYVMAMVPDLDPRRLKVGFTSGDPAARMRSLRTACPTMKLLGAWPGTRECERAAHDAVDGRIEGSEIFHVRDVAATLAQVESVVSCVNAQAHDHCEAEPTEPQDSS